MLFGQPLNVVLEVDRLIAGAEEHAEGPRLGECSCRGNIAAGQRNCVASNRHPLL